MENTFLVVGAEMSCCECNRTGDMLKCLTCECVFHAICGNYESDKIIPLCRNCQLLGKKFWKPNDWIDGLVVVISFVISEYYESPLISSTVFRDLLSYLKYHLHSECSNTDKCFAPQKAQEVLQNFICMFADLVDSCGQQHNLK